MKAFGIVNIGTEKVAALEVKELIGSKAQTAKGIVIFEFKEYGDLVRLCYLTQSMLKVCIFLSDAKIKDVGSVEKQAAKLDLKEWLKGRTFRVRSAILLNDSLQSIDVEPAAGKGIIEKSKAPLKVDLENPDLQVFVYIMENNSYIGIDFSGGNLSKRDYNLFSARTQLRPTLAYCALRIAGFKKNKSVVDPFCRSGVIPIEAALFASGLSPNHFTKDKFSFIRLGLFKDDELNSLFKKLDKKTESYKVFACDEMLRNIKAAQKNAKVAGTKDISFMKVDLSWLDTKFDKSSVDMILTVPPEITKFADKKEVEKKHKELFYQADYILKKTGNITLVSRRPGDLKKPAGEKGFNLKEETEVMQGQESYWISVFVKR